MSIHTDIEKALKDRIKLNADLTPVTWPNRSGKTAIPRYEVQVFRNPTARGTIKAGGGRYSGFAMITYVSESGVGTDTANDEADKVADWFPEDFKMPITGGTVRITETSSIKTGYSDDVSWRVPVDIKFEVLSTS